MTPSRSRNWIWYFAVLVVLAAASVTILILYNRAQQLKPEQLRQAWDLWNHKGPPAYDMDYTQQGSTPGVFKVRVRAAKVVAASRDGQPLEKRLYPYYDMAGLFGSVEDFLKRDAEAGKPRTFTVASFDPEDGHLIHYIRRVMGSQERVEITVQLHRVVEGAAATSPGSH